MDRYRVGSFPNVPIRAPQHTNTPIGLWLVRPLCQVDEQSGSWSEKDGLALRHCGTENPLRLSGAGQGRTYNAKGYGQLG